MKQSRQQGRTGDRSFLVFEIWCDDGRCVQLPFDEVSVNGELGAFVANLESAPGLTLTPHRLEVALNAVDADGQRASCRLECLECLASTGVKRCCDL